MQVGRFAGSVPAWEVHCKEVRKPLDNPVVAALDRRVIKRTPDATHTFVYDGWLLMVERVERSNGMLEQIDYWWGKDVSGTLDGAGGIGGLLFLRDNGYRLERKERRQR